MEFLKRHAMLFWKFGLVGASGTILNLGLFYVLREVWSVDLNISSGLAFLFAVTSNYFLNQNWTFRQEATGGAFQLSSYLHYGAINLLGLAVNLLALNVFVCLFHPEQEILAQAAGIASATIFNFILSKLFVFRVKEQSTKE